eukprot:3757836-Pleurochrysis_carterae.AAC.3
MPCAVAGNLYTIAKSRGGSQIEQQEHGPWRDVRRDQRKSEKAPQGAAWLSSDKQARAMTSTSIRQARAKSLAECGLDVRDKHGMSRLACRQNLRARESKRV